MPRITSKNKAKVVVEKINWKQMADQELHEYVANRVASVWGDIPDGYKVYSREIMLYIEACCEGIPVYEVMGALDGQIVIRRIDETERDVFNWKKL